MRSFQRKRQGQSVVELAIFGSIVIFVIGLILKSTLASSHTSNMDLRAFRMALRESYRTADGRYAGEFSAGRNSASFLILEDRLSIDPSSKQGTRDRAPYMAQGSGTLTHSLFMPVNDTDVYDMPVYDFIINGQWFPFSTMRVVTKNLRRMARRGEIPVCNEKGFGYITGTCVEGNPETGRFVFFRQAFNGEDEAWCSSGCPDWAFNLNFEETPFFNINTAVVPSKATGSTPLRDAMMWQWARVLQKDLAEGMMVDIDGDRKEEKLLGCADSGVPLATCDRFKVVDQQEGDFNLTVDEGAKFYWTEWRKSQLAANPYFKAPLQPRAPGLEKDMKVYSYTYDKESGGGTYLENREGKLYDSDGQFVRNETSQDHLDIIERVLRLNNDTGRFCSQGGGGTPCDSGSCSPTNWEDASWARRNGLYGMKNPVEVCGDCFSFDNHKLTCMDVNGPTIFVRSRIRDRRRTRWITRTEDR